MKTMQSLKQQFVTVLSVALVVMAIAVCVPNQALANGKGRKSAPAKVQQRNNPPQLSHSGSRRNYDFPVNDYDPQRNVAGKGVMRPTENFSLNSKAVKSSQPGGEQTRSGSTTQGKYGPKKPLGVWVWSSYDGGYVWM